MKLILIPAGEFVMGTDLNEADPSEKPQHQLYLPKYTISKYPITVAQYADFIRLSGYRPASGWTDLKLKPNHPVIQVSWDDATAFCQWASRTSNKKIRLPTEAEWEKAARGTEGCLYPWGIQPPTPILCNIENKTGEITPVDQYSPQGDSPYGCTDMLGNTWEWTSSLFRAYPYDPNDGREDPPARFADRSAEVRTLRGGAFWHKRSQMRATMRSKSEPDVSYNYFSFRVVVEV
jgi:formylglycine-generating enzyme required for sulfatase activity